MKKRVLFYAILASLLSGFAGIRLRELDPTDIQPDLLMLIFVGGIVGSIIAIVCQLSDKGNGLPIDYRELEKGVIFDVKKRWEVEVCGSRVTHAILTRSDQSELRLYVAFRDVLGQTKSQVMVDSERQVMKHLTLGDPLQVNLLIV